MFKRISNLFRGFLGLFISGMEKRNPEALLEVEKENLREQIAKYNKGLASHAALCERLMSQVKKEEKEEREVKAKVTAHMRAGNKAAAGQFALRYQNLQRDLQENRQQLAQAEETYRDLIKARDVSVQAAKSKIESLKQGISDMKVKQATAELTEMAAGMISEIGGAGDTLNRLEEMVREEREFAAGRARVAKDSLDMGQVHVQAAEQDALAEQALADFAAQEGISLDSPSTTASESTGTTTNTTAAKTMGPAAES